MPEKGAGRDSLNLPVTGSRRRVVLPIDARIHCRLRSDSLQVNVSIVPRKPPPAPDSAAGPQNDDGRFAQCPVLKGNGAISVRSRKLNPSEGTKRGVQHVERPDIRDISETPDRRISRAGFMTAGGHGQTQHRAERNPSRWTSYDRHRHRRRIGGVVAFFSTSDGGKYWARCPRRNRNSNPRHEEDV